MSSQLAPCFLVAAPWLRCPYFHHSVVMLLEHRPEGSLGFVVNRPAEVSVHHVIAELGLATTETRDADMPVLVGGPVSPHAGWVVFEPNAKLPSFEGTYEVNERVSVSASRDLLAAIAKGHGPRRHLLLLGYAGWGPEQLDAEIQRGSWIPTDLDERLVFELPHEQRWKAALAAVGIDPGQMVGDVIADA